MDNNTVIHSLLRQQFSLITTYPKAYQGVSYTPVEDILYLRESFVPAETFQVGLSHESVNKHMGIYQIMVVSPIDKGMFDTDTACNTVSSYFYRGLIVGNIVLINKVYTASSVVEGAWMYTPITIRYTALI